MPRVGQRVAKWTEIEDALIRTLYPAGGVEACLKELPKRSEQAIRGRAHHLGVHLDKEAMRFDHRALGAALGIPAHPPAPPLPATVHRCGGGT